ncbi:beta-3-deoxy-D-manno-oct-2-ulosonic acid transferase [Novosphingobium ginsenosidimutans]|nr:beta-3-deoxy-D-manno-oct-2-ulosonic acid transferase [Novosphingobium ginsenosidimutans]
MRAPAGFAVLQAPFDPWSAAQRASAVWAGAERELATIAALLGKPVQLFGERGPLRQLPDLVGDLLQSLTGKSWVSPFDGTPWDLLQVIAQLGDWRRLIASNRDLGAVYGVARWKRVTVDPLLWDGTGPVRYARRLRSDLDPGARVVAWKSRTAPAVLAELEASGSIAELEDGFIRSVGLGANCIPPLSIIVDRSGVYFDPNAPSDLEAMLECDELPAKWVERASELQTTLVHAGISKYGQGEVTKPVTVSKQRRILVTGQVEDDRSVMSGGANCTNLELIAKARALEPDAWIIYKPHPDVEAGHRKGHVPDADALRYANEIERRAPIAALLNQVDAVHVITSLTGFEALLRGKAVTTHGQPFYAGWGLTRDLGPRNPRRTRRRSLAELVAATLIGYPRCVDPVTRLPCPPEVLVQRIANGQARVASPLILLREWQGKLRLLWQRLSGGRR